MANKTFTNLLLVTTSGVAKYLKALITGNLLSLKNEDDTLVDVNIGKASATTLNLSSEPIPVVVPNITAGVLTYDQTMFAAVSTINPSAPYASVTSATKSTVGTHTTMLPVATATGKAFPIGSYVMMLPSAPDNTAACGVVGYMAIAARQLLSDTSNSTSNYQVGARFIAGHYVISPTALSNTAYGAQNYTVNYSGIINTACGALNALYLGVTGNAGANTTVTAHATLSSVYVGHGTSGAISTVTTLVNYNSTATLNNGSRVTDYYGLRLNALTLNGDTTIQVFAGESLKKIP